MLAQNEAERLVKTSGGGRAKPDLWFCYHPYYKAPDLIGPPLAVRWNIPYVTAEASYSRRRDDTGWAELQSLVVDAVRQAAVNICFTKRDEDRAGRHIPEVRLARLAAFHRRFGVSCQEPQSHRSASAGDGGDDAAG